MPVIVYVVMLEISMPWMRNPLNQRPANLCRWQRCLLPVLAGLALLVSTPVLSADRPRASFGFELQVYPTGVIPGFRYERAIAERRSLHLRVGYQEIRHEDFGVHDDERGDGAGFSIGHSWYRKASHLGWSFGIRSDLWINTLDWIDDEGTPEEMSGTTVVTVLQPTVDVTYRYALTNKLFLSPSLAAGFEINIDTDGSDVGEGFIVLAGLTFGTRW